MGRVRTARRTRYVPDERKYYHAEVKVTEGRGGFIAFGFNFNSDQLESLAKSSGDAIERLVASPEGKAQLATLGVDVATLEQVLAGYKSADTAQTKTKKKTKLSGIKGGKAAS
jgi:hypothetical protein